MHKFALAVSLQVKRILCFFLGHRIVVEKREHLVYTGCCRRLQSTAFRANLVSSRKKDLQRWLMQIASEKSPRSARTSSRRG